MCSTHGIPDPGYRYTGDIRRAAVVINEPVRRDRVTGTDLLPHFAAHTPLDIFGMAVSKLPRHGQIATDENLPQARMFGELARRRVYLHPIRWTSLGLSLLEAMHLGMPVVALATTEVAQAVPPTAGVVSTWVDVISEQASPLTVISGADSGGQNVHVAELARALGERGHHVTVYTRRDDPEVPDRVRADPGVTVEHVPAGPASRLPKDELLPYMAEFGDHLMRRWLVEPPDVAHPHFWMSGLAAHRDARGTGLPVLQTFHALGTVKRRHPGRGRPQPTVSITAGGRVGARRGAGRGDLLR